MEEECKLLDNSSDEDDEYLISTEKISAENDYISLLPKYMHLVSEVYSSSIYLWGSRDFEDQINLMTEYEYEDILARVDELDDERKNNSEEWQSNSQVGDLMKNSIPEIIQKFSNFQQHLLDTTNAVSFEAQFNNLNILHESDEGKWLNIIEISAYLALKRNIQKYFIEHSNRVQGEFEKFKWVEKESYNRLTKRSKGKKLENRDRLYLMKLIIAYPQDHSHIKRIFHLSSSTFYRLKKLVKSDMEDYASLSSQYNKELLINNVIEGKLYDIVKPPKASMSMDTIYSRFWENTSIKISKEKLRHILKHHLKYS